MLDQAFAEYGDEVEFIGVDVQDNQADAKVFLAEFGLDFDHFFDRNREIPNFYAGIGTPITFFFGPNGTLVATHNGVRRRAHLGAQHRRATQSQLLVESSPWSSHFFGRPLTGVAGLWVGVRLWPDQLPDRPLDRLIGAAAIGLFAGRLAAMIGQGVNPLTNLGDILIVRGGVSIAAASLGAVVAFMIPLRWDLSYLDAAAPAVLMGLAGWHAGCLWRGACLGTLSDLPWTWAQSPGGAGRHPVELYAAIGFAVGAFVVSQLPWQLLLRSGSAIVIAGIVRVATELVRPSIGPGPVVLYLIAITAGAGLVLSGYLIDRSRRLQPT